MIVEHIYEYGYSERRKKIFYFCLWSYSLSIYHDSETSNVTSLTLFRLHIINSSNSSSSRSVEMEIRYINMQTHICAQFTISINVVCGQCYCFYLSPTIPYAYAYWRCIGNCLSSLVVRCSCIQILDYYMSTQMLIGQVWFVSTDTDFATWNSGLSSITFVCVYCEYNYTLYS